MKALVGSIGRLGSSTEWSTRPVQGSALEGPRPGWNDLIEVLRAVEAELRLARLTTETAATRGARAGELDEILEMRTSCW